MITLLYFGLIGLTLIFLAWIPETLQTIKRKKCDLNPKFQLLYLFGSLSLLFYSIYLNDYVFLLLNIGASIMASINIYYESRERGWRRFLKS